MKRKLLLPQESENTDNTFRAFIRQLQATSYIIRFAQILVGLIFPIAEAILINFATGAPENTAKLYYIVLGVIGFVHLCLLLLVLLAEKPLTSFIYEFDALIRQKEKLEIARSFELSISSAFNDALFALNYSIVQFEQSVTSPPESIEHLLDDLLYPWVNERSSIFFFHEGNALYNFAVYLQDNEDDLLKVAWRNCDDRMTVLNRAWKVGDGHVGQCFVQQKTIFLSINTDSEYSDAVQSTQFRAEDLAYYRSMIATPIIINDNSVGVFIITSSVENQFERETHTQIIDNIGLLLALSLKFYLKEDEKREK